MNTSSRVPGVTRNSGWRAIDAMIAARKARQEQARTSPASAWALVAPVHTDCSVEHDLVPLEVVRPAPRAGHDAARGHPNFFIPERMEQTREGSTTKPLFDLNAGVGEHLHAAGTG
jgi:hypothetical protein